MILEEATKEAYGYYPKDLTHGSGKSILVACELCGEFRVVTKKSCRALCLPCMIRQKTHRAETEVLLSTNQICRSHIKERKTLLRKNYLDFKPDKNGNLIGGPLKCICEICGKTFPASILKIKTGGGRYCSYTCRGKAYKGDRSPAWRGGISFEPYCVKFNEAFKEHIRSKFGFKCFLCPTTQAENGRKLSVHHVNYNKNCGCDGDKTCQFVPLCCSCHTKTNYNRDYWQKIITDKLHCMIIGLDV